MKLLDEIKVIYAEATEHTAKENMMRYIDAMCDENGDITKEFDDTAEYNLSDMAYRNNPFASYGNNDTLYDPQNNMASHPVEKDAVYYSLLFLNMQKIFIEEIRRQENYIANHPESFSIYKQVSDVNIPDINFLKVFNTKEMTDKELLDVCLGNYDVIMVRPDVEDIVINDYKAGYFLCAYGDEALQKLDEYNDKNEIYSYDNIKEILENAIDRDNIEIER